MERLNLSAGAISHVDSEQHEEVWVLVSVTRSDGTAVFTTPTTRLEFKLRLFSAAQTRSVAQPKVTPVLTGDLTVHVQLRDPEDGFYILVATGEGFPPHDLAGDGAPGATHILALSVTEVDAIKFGGGPVAAVAQGQLVFPYVA